MGVLARVAGCVREEPVMKTLHDDRRQAWRSLSSQDKHQRLQAMRQQQQLQVQFEMLRLQSQVR
jgi:hypothetical protein